MQNFSFSRRLRAKKTGITSFWSWSKMGNATKENSENWAHETRKQIIIEMLREDKKLYCWLRAFLKSYP